MTKAKKAKTPAAMPTAAPLVRRPTFCWISALASSISSRTSSEAFSETSETISPSDLSAESGGWVPLPGVICRTFS